MMDNKPLKDKIKKVMGYVFEVEPTVIDDEVKIGDIETWDSVSHVALIVALEEEFDCKFTLEEITNANSFQKILKILQLKQ